MEIRSALSQQTRFRAPLNDDPPRRVHVARRRRGSRRTSARSSSCRSARWSSTGRTCLCSSTGSGAEEIARRIAPHLTRAPGIAWCWRPALPYGASPLAERWPGTVSLSRGTLVRVIVEVIRGLARSGLPALRPRQLSGRRRTPARDGRGAHAIARGAGAVRGLQPGRRRPSSPMVNPRVRALMRSPEPDREWHSGELETALMLAAPAGPGAPVAGQAAAARVGGLPRRARAGCPAFRGHRTGRRRLLRLARRGAREDGRARHAPARASSSPARCSRSSGVRARRPRGGWYCSAVGPGRGASVARGRGKECS